MLHDAVTFCRALLLTGAIGVLTVGAAHAAPHGGGPHGANHSGTIHSGGFHGGLHGNFHGSIHPAFRNGSHLVPPSRSFRTFVYPYPLRPYSSSYSYGYGYPYYYGSGFRYPASDSGLDQLPDLSDDRSRSGLVRPAPGKNAHVTVYVRPDAELWFDKKKAKATGGVREFVTPDLTPGHRYAYEVRALSRESGKEVTQTREAVVTAGADVEVDFQSPAPTPKPS